MMPAFGVKVGVRLWRECVIHVGRYLNQSHISLFWFRFWVWFSYNLSLVFCYLLHKHLISFWWPIRLSFEARRLDCCSSSWCVKNLIHAGLFVYISQTIGWVVNLYYSNVFLETYLEWLELFLKSLRIIHFSHITSVLYCYITQIEVATCYT